MKRIIILLSILLLLPVWAQAEIKQPGRTTMSKGLAPYVPEITTNHAPKVRQLAKQLLTLIDSMHTEEDFSVQSIQKNSGIRLNEYPDYPNRAYFGEKLTNDWGYVISLATDIDNDPTFNILFSPASSLSVKNFPDATDICIDLGHFYQELLLMGYRHTGNFRSSTRGIQFQRDRIYLDISHIGENNERIGHDCIEGLGILIFKTGK